MNEELIKRTTSVLVYHNDNIFIKYLLDNIDFLEETSKDIISELELVDFEEKEYETYMSLNEILDIVRDFLKSIDESYYQLFEELIQNGTINIYDASVKENIEEFGNEAYHESYENKYGNRVSNINIPIGHTIDDVYTIVHEFIHHTNLSKIRANDRAMFTEGVSILYEYILYNYLKSKDINQNDSKTSIMFRVKDLFNKAQMIKMYVDLIKESRKQYYLETNEEKIDEDLDIVISDMKYYLGGLIAILKYYDYTRGIMDIKNINNFNNAIVRKQNCESLNYIFMSEPTTEQITSSIEFILEELMPSINKTNK